MLPIYGLHACGQWRDQRASNTLDGGAPFYASYRCADGNWVSVGALEPQFFRVLLEQLGIDQEAFGPQRDRARWPQQRALLAAAAMAQPRAHWGESVRGQRCLLRPGAGDRGSAAASPRNVARGAFMELAGVVQPAPAPLFDGKRAVPRTAPPIPGQHGREILRELGFDETAGRRRCSQQGPPAPRVSLSNKPIKWVDSLISQCDNGGKVAVRCLIARTFQLARTSRRTNMSAPAYPIHTEPEAFARSGLDYARLIQNDRVHASLYSDSRVFHDELATMFATGWVYVGHGSEVPQPGDFATKSVGLQSVIMARHSDGEVYVMHNRCPHRASAVCHEAQGHGSRLTCRYHGWSFNMRGDLLTVPGPEGYDDSLDKSALGLPRLPRVESYRGFVFASLAPTGISLHEHLGRARESIDVICDLSPHGELDLSAGWMKTRIRANWKMIVENQVDGYRYAPFVHGSLMNANRRFATVRDRKESSPARVRDLGDGHSEIDHSTDYRQKGSTLRWTGNIEESRLPKYVAAMHAAHGSEEARRRLVDGPPHTAIFPNLFLAEMAIMVCQPVSERETIHWTTPVMLKGGEELNERTLRRGEGAVGPAGFIIADDTRRSSGDGAKGRHQPAPRVAAAQARPAHRATAPGRHANRGPDGRNHPACLLAPAVQEGHGSRAMNSQIDPAIIEFLHYEARLQDEHRYEEWEALWTEDALYWVPCNDDNADPSRQVSYIYDNRSRIASRIKQLKTGFRHAQSPQSRMRRLISNIEMQPAPEAGQVAVAANFLLIEVRHGEQNIWRGRTFYTLKNTDQGFMLKWQEGAAGEQRRTDPQPGLPHLSQAAAGAAVVCTGHRDGLSTTSCTGVEAARASAASFA